MWNDTYSYICEFFAWAEDTTDSIHFTFRASFLMIPTNGQAKLLMEKQT